MFLADIGNTHIHFFKNDVVWHKKATQSIINSIDEIIYFISVNSSLSAGLKKKTNWIDIKEKIYLNGEYKTLGIDRKLACIGIKNGIIIDAGSAITVDIMQNNEYKGGYIFPGLKVLEKSFGIISDNLNYSFNYSLSLDILPKNTQDSISFSIFYSLVSGIENLPYNLPIIITGGDAKTLAPFFKTIKIEKNLIFKNMKGIINDNSSTSKG